MHWKHAMLMGALTSLGSYFVSTSIAPKLNLPAATSQLGQYGYIAAFGAVGGVAASYIMKSKGG